MARKPLVAVGAMCVIAAAALAALVPAVLGRPLQQVHLTWRATDSDARNVLEQRFHLSEPRRVAGSTWSYVPLDRSEPTLRAIVTNPLVTDTEGINRRTFTMAARPPLTERRDGLWRGAPRITARLTLATALLLAFIGVVALVVGTAQHSGVTVTSSLDRARSSPRAVARLCRSATHRVAAHPRLAGALVTIGIVVGTAVFRFLSLEYLENDHFTYVAFGYQSALGQLPVRDYDDPGFPLGIALSALAMRLGGTTLLPEVVLTISMLALAAALAWRTSLRVSGIPLLALFATVLQVIAYPRLYSYPKILVGALAPLAFLRYSRMPSRVSAFGLALVTEVAFLLRDDLGLYVAVAAIGSIVLTHGRASETMRRVLFYMAICMVLTIPFAIYLAMFGIEADISSTVGFSRSEMRRTGQWGSVFTSGSPLAFVMALLPLVCAWLLFRRSKRGLWNEQMAAVAGTAILLLIIDAGMMRDMTPARLADVFGPAPAVVAWMGAEAIGWRRELRGRPARRGATLGLIAVAVIITFLVGAQGQFLHELRESRIPEGLRVASSHARRQIELLQTWPFTSMSQSAALEPVARYVNRCTRPDESVLIVGYYPQLPFLAQRPFAAGHPWIMRGYFESDSDQARMAQRLAGHPPAVVAIELAEATDIAGHWPAIAHHLSTYSDVKRIGEVAVRTNRELPVHGVDQETGLPCFR